MLLGKIGELIMGRLLRRLLRWVMRTLALVILLAVLWLLIAPPDLLRVASGYAAKITCSNVFLAGRSVEAIVGDDLKAPNHWIFDYMSVSADHSEGTATAAVFGIFGKQTAIYRGGLGCTLVPAPGMAEAKAIQLPQPARTPPREGHWPQGDVVEPSTDERITALLDAAAAEPGTRAIVVVHRGRLIGERYGKGFTPQTPLLGWSMTKTVTAAMVGMAVGDGKLRLEDKNLFPIWEGGPRADITVAQLLSMSSGLSFAEEYGAVSDVNRMLFLRPDMAGFAIDKPLAHAPGAKFHYSSGTTAILSQLLADRLGAETARSYAAERLFKPLGMTTAVLETDQKGTPVGSSYLYASGRDWARFGLFLLNDGVWNDQRLLPEGWVAMMSRPSTASPDYTQGHAWRQGPGSKAASFTLPAGTWWLRGHDGQSIAIIPERELVVVRLGVTPKRLGFQPQVLIEGLLRVLE